MDLDALLVSWVLHTAYGTVASPASPRAPCTWVGRRGALQDPPSSTLGGDLIWTEVPGCGAEMSLALIRSTSVCEQSLAERWFFPVL